MSEVLNIYQRLHAVMGEIDYIQKEKKQGMSYSIVSHDRVTAAVRPLLHKHGIVYNIDKLDFGQDGNRTWAKIVVCFTNIDDIDDTIHAESFGYGVDNQDKGPGKAMSYAVKYALLKTLGLETGDEPDEVQDDSANHQPDIGSVKGSGPSRFASNPLFAHLLAELKKQDNLEDLNLKWVEIKPSRDRLNTETAWFLFMEMMKYGFDIAPSRDDLYEFRVSHGTELKLLGDRSGSDLDGLQMFYNEVKKKHPEKVRV